MMEKQGERKEIEGGKEKGRHEKNPPKKLKHCEAPVKYYEK